MEFVTLGKVTATPENAEAVGNAFSIRIRDYANAEGNVRFEVCRTEDNPAAFLTLAIWENEDYWNQFAQSGGYKNYLEALPINPGKSLQM